MIVPAFYFAIGGRQRPGVVPSIPGHLVIIIATQLCQRKPPRGIQIDEKLFFEGSTGHFL